MHSLSIVIPAFRSEESLPILIGRLDEMLNESGREHEIVVVDDCSPDDTWEVLKRLKASHPAMKIVRLLKNSGQHNAILCGFNIAKGDVIVTMDDDLQNPAEEVLKLTAAIEDGFDLAIGAYDSKKHSASRNLGGQLVDSIQRQIFGLPSEFQLTSFRAIRRVVIDNVVAMGGVFPYITSMLLSQTSRVVNVAVHHEKRRFGRSNYNLKHSLLLAFNLLISYSVYPLYFVVTLCLSALVISGGLGLFVVWRVVSGGGSVPGWASTMIAVSFFNGLILLALVVHGMYLSRLNMQFTRSRVAFTIREIHE